MKAILIFPPSWTPTMPHLALPALAGYLRPRGVEVIQRDLNLEYKEANLTRGHLEAVLAQIRDHQRAGHARRTPHDGLSADTRRWAATVGPQIAADVEAAKEVMRSDAFLGERGAWALETVTQGLQLASLPYYPTLLDFSGLTSAPAEDQSSVLLRAVRDEQRNVFRSGFRQGILADIERERPDLVGISIATAAQMLAGMTLAALIKEGGFPCHGTVGGPHITAQRESIRRLPALFGLFDSAIVFDGERPLLRLLEQLPGGNLAAVPNLLYREGGAVRETPRGEPVPRADRPTPDFAGLPLERYLAPALVLPLATSRGCYHHRCTFCSVGYGERAQFQQLDPGIVVDQMLALKARHPVEHIWFVDEAVSPRNLRGISRLLAERGAPVDWSAYIRFDPGITRDLLAEMRRGGCHTLYFGLESASPAVMRAMCKGIALDTVRRILRDSAEVGLWNHLFYFFGFPGESLDDAQMTINFLYEQRPYVHSTGTGTFVLTRYAPLLENPAAYGIEHVVRDHRRDLALWYDYRVSQGLDQATAELAIQRFIDTLPAKRLGHLYTQDAHRLLYAARLRKQGAPYPAWVE